MGITGAVTPIANGLDLDIVLMTDYSAGMDGIVAAPGINSVKDLKGKTIATNIGTMNRMLLLTALEQAGLSESDVNITNMSEGDATAALVGGSIDAASIFDPQMSKAAKESGGKVIFSSKDLPGELSDVLIIKDSIVKDRADGVQGIVDAWYQVQDKYNKDSDSVVDLISPKAELTNDEFYSLLDGIDIATKDYNKEVFANNKDFKATLKEKLTNYHTLISEYEHKEISFLTVDLTEFAQIDFKSGKSAKEHIVDFLFEKLKTFLPVIKSQEWGSIIVLLPDSENIFLSIAVSAAEGMLKSIACILIEDDEIKKIEKTFSRQQMRMLLIVQIFCLHPAL